MIPKTCEDCGRPYMVNASCPGEQCADCRAGISQPQPSEDHFLMFLPGEGQIVKPETSEKPFVLDYVI